MKKIFLSILLGASIVSCQKQQTDEERRAEIEKQVQDRLAAEHQQQQANELSQKEADVNAREQALRNQQAQQNTTVAQESQTERAPAEAPERERSQASGSYSVFYDKLEPYGDWIETNDYGYVYRPREASGGNWRPYTNGRWVYTDAGWTWVSEEPFGWATYHYGRWTRLRGVGWIWVPGNQWAPAWVSWRKGGDYTGWAPLPPEARFERGTGIHNWSDSYYDIGPAQYSFVRTRQLGDQRLEAAIVPEQQNATIIQQTTNITNITYNNTTIVNNGPNFDELRGQTAQPIARLRLERENSVQGDPRSVVRGDVVAIPAPVIAVQPQDRPRSVKQTIAQTSVDNGWNGVNPGEAENARAKMRAEATAPPNAPAKKFVRANEPARPVATASVPPVATAAPAATRATPVLTIPKTTPAPAASAVRPTPVPTATAAITPRFTPRPIPTATSVSSPVATAAPPSPSATSEQEKSREANDRPREQRVPPPNATATPPVETDAAGASTPPLTKREQKQEKRAEKRAERRGAAPEASPSP